MTDPHAYFRDATATLAPDVEALVSGGLARGRTRRRRSTTLTAVAAGAAVAVVAVAAVSVPQLVDARSSRVAPSAPGRSHDRALDKRTDDQSPPKPRTLAVHPADVPQAFVWVVGGTATAAQTYPRDHGGVIADFLWNGAYTTAILDRTGTDRTPIEQCRYAAQQASARPTCEEQPDGSVHSTWQERQPLVDGGVTARGFSLYTTDGWEVAFISYNAATPKATEYTSPEPPLSFEQLERAATEGTWFAQR